MRRSAMTKGGVEVGDDIHIDGTHVLRLIAARKSEAATEAIRLLMSMPPAQTVPATPDIVEVPGTPSTSETAAPEAEGPAQSLVDDDEPMQPAPPDEEDDVAPPPPPSDEDDDVPSPPPPDEDDVAPPEPMEDDDVAPAPVVEEVEEAEEAAPAPVDEEAAAAPAPVDEEVAAAERLASQSGLRVGAKIQKKFPGYGVHRGTVVELSAVDVVVNWETDERTTLSIKEASLRVIGAPVDEEAEEASSAPALASGGEEPPRLRVGGYAIENSTGRTVRILKHERWRAPSGREHERWHMQPLGRGWIDSRMMHPDLLTPCAPPEAPPPEN